MAENYAKNVLLGIYLLIRRKVVYLRCKNSAKLLTLGKKRKNFFVLFSLNRNFAAERYKKVRLWKQMDDSQKLELVSILIDSVKPIQTRTLPDMPLEEDFPDMDKELYTPEEAYELTMKDIKAIYDKEYAV